MSTFSNNNQKPRQFLRPQPRFVEDEEQAVQPNAEQGASAEQQPAFQPRSFTIGGGNSQFRLHTNPGNSSSLFGSPTTGDQGMPASPWPMTDRQNVPTFPSPTTGRQNVPASPWPMTDRQNVPTFPPSTMGRQNVPTSPWPMTDRQNVPGFPPPATGSQNVPQFSAPVRMPLFQQPVTSGQYVPPATMPQVKQKAPSRPLPTITKPDKKTPVLAVLLNVVMLALVFWLTQNHTFQPAAGTFNAGSTTLTKSLNDITNNKELSPLLFGTNMALFHENDETILQSVQTRQLLKDIGVRVIRMPTRSNISDAVEVQAAQAIQQIGAVPLIVLSGPEYKGGGSLSQIDEHYLTLFTQVFGNETVYYEFGNEPDLNKVSPDQYVSTWNQVIPTLKQKFPMARFIAPDMGQFVRAYLTTFLEKANPVADGISWHEYTCSVDWTAQFCLDNIDSWTIHFTQARLIMQKAIGRTLPIWISEYNYVADQLVINGQPLNDGKYNNPTFMHAWMTKAMNSLVGNHIFAALQYFATNKPMPLVDNEQIAIEGSIFRDLYKKVMVNGTVPPLIQETYPTPTAQVDPNEAFSFEDGTLAGWNTSGGGLTMPTPSTEQAFDGTHSLKVTSYDGGPQASYVLSTSVNSLPSIPKPGQMITAYIYVANTAAILDAKLFVGDTQGDWHFVNPLPLTSGKWNKVWYSLPANFTRQVGQMGIQFINSTPTVKTAIYVDAMNWT